MFTNPLNRKYESGGSVPNKANSLVEKASKNSGVSVKELTDKMNEFSSDEAKGGAFAELIKSAASDKDSQERREAVASLKAMFKKSTKFADGGKFQDFVCKHARGGNVDCGCGGMKVVRGQEGIESIPTPKDSTVNKAGFVVYPAFKETLPTGEVVETAYGHDKDGQWVQRRRWSNGGYTYLGGYNDDGQFRKDGDIRYPASSEIARYFENPLARMVKYSKPESKEDGGVVSEQEGGELTRRQALTGAQWAMGRGTSPVSRDTARLAYINAKNALRNNSDLRGRDLRQAAREMISRPPQAPIPEMEQIDFNTLNNGTVLSPIKNPQFIEEPIFTDEELNQMGDQAVNDAMSGLSRNTRNTRNRGNNAIAGAVQHFATIAPSTVGAVNYGGYDTSNFGKLFKGIRNWLKKEDGGIIMGLDGLRLSRKQARELSALNNGYNRGQFQLAMANADAALRNNTDLRGRELRQAKRAMVAGITPMERTVTMESSPVELNISLPTAETISNLNPNLELPVREVATPTSTNTIVRTKQPSRAAQALDNAVQYFATTAPSIVGAINYEGYRNPGQNFKAMWRDLFGKKK